MPVPWFLLSLALGRSPVVLSLERLVGSQDATRCSPGLSCHLWGPWEEPEDEEKFGKVAGPELEEPRNASLQAQVVLSFQAYPTARCVLLEVRVPAALVQPGQSVGSVVFDCFEAALGTEVQIWSYTQPRYQKEVNLTLQLPALPWLSVTADGDDVLLVLDVSEEQSFGLSLYWNQVQGPIKPWWHRNLTGPQTITLNHTDIVPCLCVQAWTLEPDSVRTNICPFRKDIHQRWVLVWLACLLFAAALFLLLLLKKDHVKGAARGRAALLLYSADDAGFERLVGALASALCQLPLRVAVDLWSRRELSAQGPLAWFHAQRRQTVQEGGTVVLIFSPGAVALCHEWLQDGAPAPRAHGPHDAFAASLSCVLPDFLQGRAPGRYVGAYFDRLLHRDAVPALFRTVPVFSLPSQLPDFLGTLQGPGAPRPGRLGEKAEQVSRALQPALDSCLRSPGTPGTGRGMGPEAGDRT
ncbi:hypothetical protein HPG69_008276 [Diceros bicornis minor]|uniref:Interleukin-17 receptor C n=1 Tax=Diceros bicornis minor TaxID=77932 RepID=A0A7J7F4B6_DICBM|nr:hypothetical protein HPG69_008276 [Diceros bicornis minor]